MARNDTSVGPKNPEMIRPIAALGRIFPVAYAVNAGHPVFGAVDLIFHGVRQ